MRKMRFMWKWSGSGNGSCPSLIETDDGYIVIGQELDPETRAQALALAEENNSGIGPGETVLFVPAEVRRALKGS